MSRPSVSAVITYHDSPTTITAVLDALVRQEHPLEKIIVVDNGSQVGLEDMTGAYPQLAVVRLSENTGVSHARNVGLSEVDSEFVLLLDDDVYPAPECVGRMVAAAQETSAAAVCPRIVLHPADSIIQCEGASIHFAGMLTLNNKDAPVGGSEAIRRECGAFIGACILMRPPLLRDLGGFDEDYFFYFEDLELSYRLRAMGHSIWCEPGAVALHERGGGTPDLSFRGQGTYPRARAYYTLRHRWLTMALHFQLRTMLALLPALALYDLAAFVECIGRGWLLEWFRACWSLLRGAPGILKRRKRWQAGRLTPDRDILSGGELPFATGFVRPGFALSAVRMLSRWMDHYWNWARRWL